jgi:phage tail sheath protein FI
MMGTVAVTANVATVTATIASGEQGSGAFTRQYTAGDIIKINGEERKIKAVTNTSSMTTTVAFTNTASAQTHSRTWEYAGSFDKEPVTTSHTAKKGGALYDEVHVVVVDEDGEWTGTRETALETFTGVSVAKGSRNEDGTSAYYVDAINRKSKYIWWMDHDALGDAYTTAGATVSAWGTAANSTIEYASSAATGSLIKTLSLSGGVDGSAPSDADKITAFNKFKDAEEVDIGLIVGGEASATVALQLIAIAEGRKDVVAFLSPEQSDVVNSEGTEADNVVDFRNSLGSSSYAVLDSGWKYQYDKYNDVYRYVPLCGDTAGVTAATEASRDAWFSPAGFNRGNFRNVIKLPFNPRKSERDTLYKNGVNPVTTFMGSGTVLFGDKTLLAKPSAFDRINVRRLFIIMEKAIARFARAQLFEFNDAFTRAQFVGAVEPFLRNVQGRDGITDFKVVCDGSNNTGDVVDRNEFVGDIYVKPNRSINFIQLNFVAVRSGVAFSEVIG